ncbi:hypothetical protein D0862_06284 [Hortaea werneckii]|uniref:N-acetyltransferase domain-containing protein n=1 Tax=Hortaea werneckii TaxID=91943 RepID=A0A3M7GKF7_HORWE|nr:hypothetical protein D0862_06284 [Hortaea werneckii]
MAEQKFYVSRLEPSEDMLELVQVAYDCFPPMIREIFMGCKSEADLPRLAEHYLKEIREDPFPASADDKPAEWLEGEDLTKATQILGKMNAARRAANPNGYVHLHICFTHPNYRRKGAGGMMMIWGCNVADALMLPSWIEASPEGNFLYKRFGFYDYERIYDGEFGDSSNMRREPRGLVQPGGEQ